MKKLKEINTFLVSKPTVITKILIREGFNGTVVNRALLSLYGGSLKITLTVPLSDAFVFV